MKNRVKMDTKKSLLLFFACIGSAAAQNGSCPDQGGVIAGCILGTLAFCLLVIAVTLLVLYFYRKRKLQSKDHTKGAKNSGGNLIPNDTKVDQAYDNPVFKDETDAAVQAEQGFAGYVQCKEYVRVNPPEKKKDPHVKNNGIYGRQFSSQRSLNPTTLNQEAEFVTVPLQSQDFIGLGFHINGNMRDGIFVSQVNNSGPALDSGAIHPGDRIMGVYVSFEGIVYEDALTILSYGSPYPVKVDLQKNPKSPGVNVTPSKRASDVSQTSETLSHLSHPKYRSHSLDDLSKIEKELPPHHHRSYTEKVEKSPVQNASNLHKFKDYTNLHDEIEVEIVQPSEEKRQSVSNLSQLSFPEMGDFNADDFIAQANKNHGEKQKANMGVFVSVPDSESDTETLSVPNQTDSMCNYAGSEMDIPVHVDVEADIHTEQMAVEEVVLPVMSAPDIECAPPAYSESYSGDADIPVDDVVIPEVSAPEVHASLPWEPVSYNGDADIPVEGVVIPEVSAPEVHASLPWESVSYNGDADIPVEDVVIPEVSAPEVHASLPWESVSYNGDADIPVEDVVIPEVSAPEVHASLPWEPVSYNGDADIPVEDVVIPEVSAPDVHASLPSEPVSYNGDADIPVEDVVIPEVSAPDVHASLPLEPVSDAGFQQTFNGLSDQDKMDVIRLSYEEPDITVETVALESDHSSPAVSPGSNKRKALLPQNDFPSKKQELDLDSGMEFNMDVASGIASFNGELDDTDIPTSPRSDKLDKTVAPVFDVRSDEGHTNSHSSSHSNSPTLELANDNTQLDVEPSTEVNVFSGFSMETVIGGASTFMTDIPDLRNDNSADNFLSDGQAQAEAEPQTLLEGGMSVPSINVDVDSTSDFDTRDVSVTVDEDDRQSSSSDIGEDIVMPEVQVRDKNFNPDFSLYEREADSPPKEKEKVTIDLFPDDFKIPEFKLQNERDNSMSPVSSIAEEEIVADNLARKPLDVNLDLDPVKSEAEKIKMPMMYEEPNIEIETPERNQTPAQKLTLMFTDNEDVKAFLSEDPSATESSDSQSFEDLDKNRNKKDDRVLDIEKEFEQLQEFPSEKATPAGDFFFAKPVVVVPEEEQSSPPPTPTSDKDAENIIDTKIPDVKIRPHSPRTATTNIRSSLNSARAKFFADMHSPEKEVKPFSPPKFNEPINQNGKSDSASSLETTPVSTPEKLHFPLDNIEVMHKRRHSGDLTPPGHSPTQLVFPIDVDQAVDK